MRAGKECDGVPDRAADTAAVAAYREGFALSHYGLGSAVAVVLFLILLAFSLPIITMSQPELFPWIWVRPFQASRRDVHHRASYNRAWQR